MIQLVITRTARAWRAILTVLLCLALPAIARAQTADTVYTDALVNGWTNYSWATVNFSNTSPVQAGSDSISVSAGPYQALYLHQTAFNSCLSIGDDNPDTRIVGLRQLDLDVNNWWRLVE